MRLAMLALVIAACTGSPSSTGTTTPAPPQDTRTPLEKRRDAACEHVGAKASQCAVEDAKRDLDAGKITKGQYDKDAGPDVVRKNTDVYVRKCQHDQMSSRQVRVMEVCMKEETECGPWQSCIANMQPPGTP